MFSNLSRRFPWKESGLFRQSYLQGSVNLSIDCLFFVLLLPNYTTLFWIVWFSSLPRRRSYGFVTQSFLERNAFFAWRTRGEFLPTYFYREQDRQLNQSRKWTSFYSEVRYLSVAKHYNRLKLTRNSYTVRGKQRFPCSHIQIIFYAFKLIYLSVNVFSTKLLIGDTILTSPTGSTGDGTAIWRGHPSHAKV